MRIKVGIGKDPQGWFTKFQEAFTDIEIRSRLNHKFYKIRLAKDEMVV